jgi:hypothetical protein
MDPDQAAWMRRLVWIHAGRKPIIMVLSWHGSNLVKFKFIVLDGYLELLVYQCYGLTA